MESAKTAFAPQLIISHGTMDLEFYKKAFGAVETKRLTNDDGSSCFGDAYRRRHVSFS